MKKKFFFTLLMQILFLTSMNNKSSVVFATETNLLYHNCTVIGLGTNDDPSLYHQPEDKRRYFLTVKCTEGDADLRIHYVGTNMGQAFYKISAIAMVTGGKLDIIANPTTKAVISLTTTNPNIE